VALYTLDDPGDLIGPSLIGAFDGWVDAGSAATSALEHLALTGDIIVRFDEDELLDYRARRPTLEIVDGRLAELTWSNLTIRRARAGDRDLLVMTGAEPDYRWRAFSDAIVDVAKRLGVTEWISLGSIPAAVPHTRDVPILGTESWPGLLRGAIRPGPAGILRVPSAAISVLEMAVAKAGIPSLGYFAQVPHYVSGPYPAAAVALLEVLGTHLGVKLEAGSLESEARQLRTRLDAAAAVEETTRQYVERLEGMVDEERLPSGDDLIGEIEKFLRDRGSEGTQRS
jgi:proteasome assembly chaperone (PAC2) family protein